jgi:thiol-disulfide isomerase/thioredoxin
MTEPQAQPFDKVRRRAVVAVAALAGALAVLAGIYGIGRLRGNPDETVCRPAFELARRIAPLAHGEVAALAVAQKPFRVPELVFKDADGHSRNIRDWRGRTVLLNLWATWCVPCRKEMPALDALERKLGGPDFEVVAINIDTRDPDKPRIWLNEVGVKRLAYYSDASAKVFQDLKLAGKAFGMPATMLIDRAGCEIGTMAGPAEWASEDAVKLVQASLRRDGAPTSAR